MLRQRKQDRPALLSPWHWLSPKKSWVLLRTLVDKLKLPKSGWTSVDMYWCSHYEIGTQSTTGTHVIFIPPEDDRDKERTPLDSLAAVHRWTTNFFRERIDREDNTPTLTRLHQFRKLGRTNAVTLCRTLLERQDVIQMGREDFW